MLHPRRRTRHREGRGIRPASLAAEKTPHPDKAPRRRIEAARSATMEIPGVGEQPHEVAFKWLPALGGSGVDPGQFA